MAWWGALTLLFAIEGVVLSLRYDIPRLPLGSAWWLFPLAHAPKMLGPGFLAAGLMAILSGSRSSLLVGNNPERTIEFRAHGMTGLMVHLAALAVFVGLTNQVCAGDVFATRWPAAWVLGWYASGLAVLLTWLNALHPGAKHHAGGRRLLSAAAAGGVVAVGGYALGAMSGRLWEPLAWATLMVVRAILGLVCGDVVCDPTRNVIGVEGFTVQIAPGCSGYEGIGLVWGFLAAYLPWSRRSLRWPHAWLLIALGTGAIWLVNSARITALILIGAWGSPEVAMGGFHSQAGCLGFLVTSLTLVAVSRRSRFFRAGGGAEAATEAASPESAAEVNPTAAYLVPFLAIVATTMATGAISTGFDALYPLRIVAGGVALWGLHRAYQGRLLDWSWLAVLVGVGVFGLWVVLEPANASGAQALEAGFARLPRGWAWVWLGFRVVGSVVVVPLAEEWAFRGYLTRRLIASDFESVPLGRFTWFSFVLSSLAFGLLHGRWFAGTLAGLIYAGVYYRRGRVGDAALAHAVTNACIAATVLVTRDWTYWS